MSTRKGKHLVKSHDFYSGKFDICFFIPEWIQKGMRKNRFVSEIRYKNKSYSVIKWFLKSEQKNLEERIRHFVFVPNSRGERERKRKHRCYWMVTIGVSSVRSSNSHGNITSSTSFEQSFEFTRIIDVSKWDFRRTDWKAILTESLNRIFR